MTNSSSMKNIFERYKILNGNTTDQRIFSPYLIGDKQNAGDSDEVVEKEIKWI